MHTCPRGQSALLLHSSTALVEPPSVSVEVAVALLLAPSPDPVLVIGSIVVAASSEVVLSSPHPATRHTSASILRRFNPVIAFRAIPCS